MYCRYSILILLVTIFSLGCCIPRKNSSHRKEKLIPGDGRSSIRKLCPPRIKLNCLNVMYSKPCNINYDCSNVGPKMICCQTGCSGSSKFMCIPEENTQCPSLQPAYYTGMRKCRAESDCDRGFTCCLNMAGEGFCHKPNQ